MGQSISAFRGAYDFLSNFYPAPITYNGLVFQNNEAAFQAAKCPERSAEFCFLNPSEAKRLGRRVKLRNDWDQIKDNLRRNAQNFRITDEHLGEGGPKAKFQANVNAIRLLKELEAAGQQASPEQQEVLSRYVGWGGLSDAFDPEKPAWALEYAQLKELLTPEEYAAARSSTLNAHYTSPMVMYEICKAKFRQNPDLAERLISTSDFELIEGNNWGDHIWGVCDGYGENRLGKILMRIREELIHG